MIMELQKSGRRNKRQEDNTNARHSLKPKRIKGQFTRPRGCSYQLSSPLNDTVEANVEDFRRIPGVQEVQCTGEELKGDVGIFSLTLYAADNKRSLSSVNLVTKTCSASSVFASCFIDDSDTRKTRIRALITDLVEEEVREFGCNLTTFVGSSKQTTFVNWWLPVSRPSEYQLSINSVSTQSAGINV
ncbi:hypothetical protein C0Q70_12571 [Pomacea canaliculata]|uniref:Uncharacterized protein n=1 Tax=Pomacea canaliculata TaxID=400727 RepID=A0A2T7P1Z5_POMCA|nr:hypothetical protein C0Q70_12571 [Pomacea canaliculata]